MIYFYNCKGYCIYYSTALAYGRGMISASTVAHPNFEAWHAGTARPNFEA